MDVFFERSPGGTELEAHAPYKTNGNGIATQNAGLILPQVHVALPWMHGAAIAFVFGEFGVAEGVVQVIAESSAHDRVAVKLRDRLA